MRRPDPAEASTMPVPSRSRRTRSRTALRWGGAYLVAVGLSLLAYVAFQLWGTGVYTARAQSQLTAEIRAKGFPSRLIPGGAVGFIRIAAIGLDMAFVQGTEGPDLAKGPGHYPDTPLPGQGGNVVIAGHRTTHQAPFWSLDSLGEGDQIVLQTRAGTFVYRVQWVKVVQPDDFWIARQTTRPSLTLTTCYPRFSRKERLVVRAVQVYGRVPGGFLDVRREFSPLSP